MPKKFESLSALNRFLGRKGTNLEEYLGKKIAKQALRLWFKYGNHAELTDAGCLVFVEKGGKQNDKRK